MDPITITEIDTFVSDTLDEVHNFKIRFLQEQVAPLVGKVMTIERTLKDPASGNKQTLQLEATITGARWSYEDSIVFKVTYVHPFTGVTVESEAGA